MGNIWSFLVQTLTVSAVALLLLALKWLLADKLSPRWQYAAWSLLVLRAVLPAPVNTYVLLPIPLWVERWKSIVEAALRSAYAGSYVPVSIAHVLPAPSGEPRSVTDWLFVIYGAGVIVCLLGYSLSYLRLRLLLWKGREVDGAVLEPVCRKYGLKPCRVVAVDGLETAFVCGVLRPVMAVPARKIPDEKVLLHELLHLKYQDALQSILWTLLRCLHWCNPLLQLVFCRVENDMESLCDQRVLERLEGEERREYGKILLDMASRRYARAPGTSSISNGSSNISRRIAAIVRFKKYPRGMALVSVCMILVLLVPTVRGEAYSTDRVWPQDKQEMESALASTRLRRCTTVAGALDTYAKGLLIGNVVYIATASPLERQSQLAELDSWSSGEDFSQVWTGEGYEIYGLREQADGSYLAWLAFCTYAQAAEDGTEEHTLMIPVLVSREGHGWTVREAGERFTVEAPRDQLEFWHEEGPWTRTLYAQGKTGTVTVTRISIHEVANMTQSGDMFGWISSFDTAMNPDAEFDYITYMDNTVYVCADPQGPKNKVGIYLEPMESPTDDVQLPLTQTGTGSGGSSDGDHHQNLRVKEGWDGILETGNGTSWSADWEESEWVSCYKVGIYWDGQLVEQLVAAEVSK